MLYIVVGIIILGLIAATIGFLGNRKRQRLTKRGISTPEEESGPVIPTECCGQHEVCERESLLAAANKKIEYYDDEELDAYKGIASDKYSEKVIDEFRDVLYTLREVEVSGWLHSLQLRDINLPDQLKDEAFLLIESGELKVEN